MKRLFLFFTASLLFLSCSFAYGAFDVFFGCDVAPNKALDISAYNTWWNTTKAAVVGGTFVDMTNAMYKWHHKVNPLDEAVYSFAPYGSRMHWVYWVPSITEAEFLTHNFEGKMHFDWEGSWYTYDFDAGTMVPNTPDAGWYAVENYEVYNGGIIGTFGHAWWVAYGETSPTPEALRILNDDLDDILASSGWIVGSIHFTASDLQEMSMPMSVVPEPASLMLMGTALLGLIGRRCLRKKRRA